MQNRINARWLADKCPECGFPGKHFVQTESAIPWIGGIQKYNDGFWTCDKFYDPVTKRRIGA
jgi:hypothetical protein